jgi:hypothetical protein
MPIKLIRSIRHIFVITKIKYVFYWGASDDYMTGNMIELVRQLNIIADKKEGIKSLPEGIFFYYRWHL